MMKVMLHQHKEMSSSSYAAFGRDKVFSCSKKKISEEKSSDNSLDEAPKVVTSMILLFTTI